MSDTSNSNLLSQLLKDGNSDAWATLAASKPKHEDEMARKANEEDEKLKKLLNRVSNLAEGKESDAATDNSEPSSDPAAPSGDGVQTPGDFIPKEPRSFKEAMLSDADVEGLLLKALLGCGSATGRDLADQIKLPFVLLDELLRGMKQQQLVGYRGAASMSDFEYQLTETGRERARRMTEHCSYYGAAPVALKHYVEAVKLQSLTTQHPTVEQLKQAFGDLLLNERMMNRLGPAINSGRGLFLYGAAGNGKTSIAERVTKAFGQFVWIPRALNIDGEIIRLFDPSNHEEAPLTKSEGFLDQLNFDKRWVRIRRPTLVVGGELTMQQLELTFNRTTGISEASLQLKSNCGTLVIDDFGRQRMAPAELLNRWIVPLEKRYDYLNLANGKKVEVPFDQLIIFSTNLQPKDLCDDAFLRRIPYKIDVMDPNEEEFVRLFSMVASGMGFEIREESIRYLIEKHFLAKNRPMRCCHPRDLLLQIRNLCHYQNKPVEMSNEFFDFAVENYFAVM